MQNTTNWQQQAITKIKRECRTTTTQLNNDVIYHQDEIILCAPTAETLLESFINEMTNYNVKLNLNRISLVFWRMLNSIEYSADMGQYIINIDRERLDKFVKD